MKIRSVIWETIFLQAVIVFVGVGALAFLLWEPHFEGRNADATVYEIYFDDPFLAYAYIASVPFFVALVQAFKVLRYAATNRIFSQDAVKAVRTIRFCAMVLVAFVIVGEIMILPYADDLPPPVVMGVVVILGSAVVATAMSVLEQILHKAIGSPSRSPSAV